MDETQKVCREYCAESDGYRGGSWRGSVGVHAFEIKGLTEYNVTGATALPGIYHGDGLVKGSERLRSVPSWARSLYNPSKNSETPRCWQEDLQRNSTSTYEMAGLGIWSTKIIHSDTPSVRNRGLWIHPN